MFSKFPLVKKTGPSPRGAGLIAWLIKEVVYLYYPPDGVGDTTWVAVGLGSLVDVTVGNEKSGVAVGIGVSVAVGSGVGVSVGGPSSAGVS